MLLVRLPKLVSALAILCVAACDLTLQPGKPASDKVVTPFTWKANTPRATIAKDLNECELAGRGTEDDYSKGTILAAPDVYPPLDKIMCLNPIARHMVVRS